MKKIILLPVFLFITKSLFAQTQKELDSLNNIVAASTQDTAKVTALGMLSYYENDPARRLQLVSDALTLTRKIKFENGEAICYHHLGNHFLRISDFPKSLEYNFKALKLRERIQTPEGIAVSTNSIGIIYFYLGNHEAALTYYFKTVEAFKQINVPHRWIQLYSDIAAVYEKQNKLDSALTYYNRSYEYAMSPLQSTFNYKYQLSATLIGLGNVQAAMGNTDIALSYYKKSIENATEFNNARSLARNYLALSKLFMKISNKDSAIYYAHRALTFSEKGQVRTITVESARQLSYLYENKDDTKALQYNKLAMDANDSIFSASNNAQIQTLTFSEQERQREINEVKLKDAEERNHNLQYAAIAVGLITFIILFLVLSRSIIVKQKFIEFFAILGLLAVFEFINLFIHPYLANITNHSPVLMLVILIAIGALLIPLHHKLEKWITKIMIEKNKKIRLAAARKTIATLEGEQTN